MARSSLNVQDRLVFKTHLDLGFFVLYLIFNIFIGLWASRRKVSSAQDYFLAGDCLPGERRPVRFPSVGWAVPS